MVSHGENHGLFWVIFLQYCDQCKRGAINLKLEPESYFVE